MVEIKEKTVLAGKEFEQAVTRLSQVILEDAPRQKELVLVGIATGGVPLAKRIQATLATKSRVALLGILDITFYRDDLALRESHPVIRRTDIPFNLDNKHVVLVDDVLYSGRTTRAAMDALVDFGRPDVVRLAVLVDRGHRELPILANFIGLDLKTEKSDEVRVQWTDLGEKSDQVLLLKGKA